LFPPDHQCDFILVLDALRLLQGIISEEAGCKTVLQDSYASVAPLFADLLLVLSHNAQAVALPVDQVQGQPRETREIPDIRDADLANFKQNLSL